MSLLEFVRQIFGEYTPHSFPVPLIEHLAEGETQVYYEVIPAGLSGVDWEYVLSGLIFCIVLYSVLRIIGAVISRV